MIDPIPEKTTGMAEDKTQTTPEFSRVIALSALEDGPITIDIWAEPEERVRLARRFGLLALDLLGAELEIAALGPDAVRVTGRLHASLAQPCVASLEPVEARLDDAFTVLWSAGAGWLDEDEDGLEFEVEGLVADDHGDSVDLGEAVAQQLALLLDPYPRAPEAPVTAAEESKEAGDGPTRRPFAESEALKALRKRLN